MIQAEFFMAEAAFRCTTDPLIGVAGRCQVPQVQYVEKIVEVPEVRIQEASTLRSRR